MSEPDSQFCVLCPGRERLPHRPPVCEACRSWLAGMLWDLAELTAEVEAGPHLVPDLRLAPIVDPDVLKKTGERIAWRDLDDKLILRRRDPIAALIPSGSAGNKVGAGPVGGSKEPPVPIRVDEIDILGASRRGGLMPHMRQQEGTDEDQVGFLPLATVLDTWVRDWVEARAAGEGLPVSHVKELLDWLSVRVDWACDEHPAIDEFAGEIRRYRSALRALLGLIEVPDYKVGVACPKCQARSLFQRHGGIRDGSLWIECAECPSILSPDEYADHAATLQADAIRTTVAMIAYARSHPVA